MPTFLAYRPFLDPIDVSAFWYLLLIPLALGVAAVYKAVRVRSMNDYPKEVAVMTVQVVLGVAGLAVGFYVLVSLVMPRIFTPA